ncbi:MAG: terpene cyclase/mutase family protein, partial [Candidatus Lokiarchaeota archaeon]|nr:terpene cyclase/mutase family protein [Candidatus Lokiarchaeota archaeon]
LRCDPVPSLRAVSSTALRYHVKRDITGDDPGPVESLWALPGAVQIIKKQQPSGAWPDPRQARHAGSPTNYLQVETYRNLAVLIEVYGFTRAHPAIRKAVEYLFSTQTSEGDFRGVYGGQYTPNYCGGILELVVKAGYDGDPRVDKAFSWFLGHQQEGGGWTLPMQTHGVKSNDSEESMRSAIPLPVEPGKPFSHMVTGIVLRAFAAHPTYRSHPGAVRAGKLIATRFFKTDSYSSRRGAGYWTKYSFPFWWTDLISVLDALSKMPIPRAEPGVQKALV